jgi:hypothetical protein
MMDRAKDIKKPPTRDLERSRHGGWASEILQISLIDLIDDFYIP